MESMQELYAAYAEQRGKLKELGNKIKNHERLIAKHEAAIKRIESRYNKISDKSNWVKMIVYPLAEALKNITGAEKFDVLGPFGLRAETSIYVQKGKSRGGITLTPYDNFRLHYDTGEKNRDYPENSIGALNGMDNVTAPLPDNVSEIAALLRWFDKEV